MFFRGRRLRKNSTIRSMVRENRLNKDDLIYPIFVVDGKNVKREISSLPNNYHYSIDRLCDVVEEMNECGVKSCILFGVPDHKDCLGSGAYDFDNDYIEDWIPDLKIYGKQ